MSRPNDLKIACRYWYGTKPVIVWAFRHAEDRVLAFCEVEGTNTAYWIEPRHLHEQEPTP